MFLLFDIGGTKIRIAISKDGENFQEPKVFSTPDNFDDGAEVFKKVVYELKLNGKLKAAAGGIAGSLNREKGALFNSPNLPNWAQKPIRSILEKVLGAPVTLENDAALAALGEAVKGAGRGKPIVGYIAPGTGLGGARIVDLQVDRAAFGFEPGHQIINFNAGSEKNICANCDQPGHLESYVGGLSVEKRFGKKPEKITDEKTWDEIAKYLAYGLNNIAVLWSPDVIVLGGSMILGNPGISVRRVQFYLKRLMKIFPPPPVKKAELKDFGGLHGALTILKSKK